MPRFNAPVQRVGAWQIWKQEADDEASMTRDDKVRAMAGYTIRTARDDIYNAKSARRVWQPSTMRHLIEHSQAPWQPHPEPAERDTATVWKGVYPESAKTKLRSHYRAELQTTCRHVAPKRFAQVDKMLDQNAGREANLLGAMTMRAGSSGGGGGGGGAATAAGLGASSSSSSSSSSTAGGRTGWAEASTWGGSNTWGSTPWEPIGHWSERIVHALDTGDEGALQDALASEGANVDEQVRWGGKHGRSGAGWGWNFEAYFGEAGGVEWGKGACKRHGFVDGDTVLMLALKTGSPKLVLEVLEFGPDLALRNAWGQDAHEVATKKGMEFLLPKPRALEEEEGAPEPAGSEVGDEEPEGEQDDASA